MLKDFYPLTYAIIYSVSMLCFAVLVLIQKPLNYQKLNWVYFTLLVQITFIFIMVTASMHQSQRVVLALQIILAIGCGLIAAIGAKQILKSPSLLKQIKPDLENLFRFAFRLKTNPSLLINHITQQNKRVKQCREFLINNLKNSLDYEDQITQYQSTILLLQNASVLLSLNNSKIRLETMQDSEELRFFERVQNNPDHNLSKPSLTNQFMDSQLKNPHQIIALSKNTNSEKSQTNQAEILTKDYIINLSNFKSTELSRNQQETTSKALNS